MTVASRSPSAEQWQSAGREQPFDVGLWWGFDGGLGVVLVVLTSRDLVLSAGARKINIFISNIIRCSILGTDNMTGSV